MYTNLVNVAKGFYSTLPQKKYLFIKCNSNTVILIYIIYFFFTREGFFEQLIYKPFLKIAHFIRKQIYVSYYLEIFEYYFRVLLTYIFECYEMGFMCLSTHPNSDNNI